jgi:hypothetical protein
VKRPIDPCICNALFDANAFDPHRTPDDPAVARLLELARNGKLLLLSPWSVGQETQHPNTPTAVKKAALSTIFTVKVGQTRSEQERYQRIRKILQGNAKPGKHDADARHLAEAEKYGSYFITHDDRIHRQKREALQDVPGGSFWIVTVEELLEIYDWYEANRPQGRR